MVCDGENRKKDIRKPMSKQDWHCVNIKHKFCLILFRGK